MSHFTVLVICKDEGEVEELLAPYDEEIRVDPYEKGEDNLQAMKDHYKTDNLQELAAKMEDWSGYKGEVKDGKLIYWCTYNPESKWDWYEVGGRWKGDIKGKNKDKISDIMKMGDDKMSYVPFAVVTPDGEWHESGKMGWFGMSSDNKEEDKWRKEVRNIYSKYPNYIGVLVDCHI